MTRSTCALVAMLLGCGAQPAVAPDAASGPRKHASEVSYKLRFADRSGSVAKMSYSISDPLTLHVTATLEPELLSGISPESAWIVARCQDGPKVISGRGYPQRFGTSKYVRGLIDIGREQLPSPCNLAVYAGQGYGPSGEDVLLGSYCISDLRLSAGACPQAIEAVEPRHEQLRVDWWAAKRRPDGVLHINAGIEHGSNSYAMRKAEVVIRCPHERGRIVDGFDVETARFGPSGSPQTWDIESEDGFVFGATEWPGAPQPDNCDVKLQAIDNSGLRRGTQREVFGRACWRGGTIHRGECDRPATPRPLAAGSTRPFRVDAMIHKTDSDVYPYSVVVEVQANPGGLHTSMEAKGSCSGRERAVSVSISQMELERLAPGDIMRATGNMLKSMPRKCRLDFSTETSFKEPVPLASVCLAKGKAVPC